METLQLFRGDTVMVKGKKRKNTVLIVLNDDELDDGSARINRVVRHNLRVKHGDIVTVDPCADIKYVRVIEALLETIELMILSRRNVSQSSPSKTQSRVSPALYSMSTSPHTSVKLTGQCDKVISSQFAEA